MATELLLGDVIINGIKSDRNIGDLYNEWTTEDKKRERQDISARLNLAVQGFLFGGDVNDSNAIINDINTTQGLSDKVREIICSDSAGNIIAC